MNTDISATKINLYTEDRVISFDVNFLKSADVEVNYTDGLLTLTADGTLVNKIEITWQADFNENALFLSDALERSYGELCWQSMSTVGKMPWYFLVCQDEKTYAFGVKTGANALCHFTYAGGVVTLVADVRAASQPLDLSGRTLNVCEFVSSVYTCPAFEALGLFCKKMCPNPRTINKPVFGGNDWYCNYGNTSYEKILEHSRRIALCAKGLPVKPYMVIDDGWQLCRFKGFSGGPWTKSNDNFEDMKALARDMEDIGVIPGLWMRPLVTSEKLPDDCYYYHPSGDTWFLDPTKEYVLNKISHSIKTIVDWGFKLIKQDFSTYDILGMWGFEMTNDTVGENMKFSTNKFTTAEVIKNLYSVIREAAGEDTVIIGCNTIGHLAAGYFEIQRIGDDTSGFNWEVTKKMGINTLAFRLPQHKAFFEIDADCVGIMNKMHDGSKTAEKGEFLVPWSKNRQWLNLVAQSGTPLFISIGEECFTEEVQKDVTAAFETMCSHDVGIEPLDWQKTKTPSLWKTKTGKIINYEW